MVVDERLTVFLHSMQPKQSELLQLIGNQARADGVPIVRIETGALLRTLVCMQRPKRILEIGTAVGYSAILMWECLDTDAEIVTIENYDKRIAVAKENFKLAGCEKQVKLLEGDALTVMQGLETGFDFVFMDAAKGQYIHFLPEVMRLLKKGGVLVSDNVLQDGDVIESRFAVRRRDRTIHSRMREYLWQIKHMPQLETSVLTVGDGVTLSVKVAD